MKRSIGNSVSCTRSNSFRAFTIRAALIAIATASATGCSQFTGPQTPDFYPNEAYVQGGSGAARDAERQCMSMADEYVREPNKYTDALKQGATGAAVGAGTGALGGVIMKGKVGRATAAGAAIGGIIGVLKSASETGDRSPSYQRFVEHCLHKKGNEVTGGSSE